mgnify:CR=1 FL=1
MNAQTGASVAPDVAARVLVVDDEQPILRALATNLRARGYTIDLAPTGEDALAMAARHRPDAVILDLGLPGLSGIEVIEGLRGWTKVPIIILSARGAERDKVAALDAGADDYVTKPFSPRELVLRAKAVLKRGADLPAAEAGRIRQRDRTTMMLSAAARHRRSPAATQRAIRRC